jgi:hypothetical protein
MTGKAYEKEYQKRISKYGRRERRSYSTRKDIKEWGQ